MEGKYIFLSYSTADTANAYKLKEILESKEYSVWMAPDGIPVGKQYPEVIEDSIKNAHILLLLASKSIIHSNWVDKEVERAINYSKKIFVIKIDNFVFNDIFNFLLSLTQSKYVEEISLNNENFLSVLNDLSELYESNKTIHLAYKNNILGYDVNNKQELLIEADKLIDVFINDDNIVDALSVLHFKDVNKYIFANYIDLGSDKKNIICENLKNAYISAFNDASLYGRRENAVKGQIMYYLSRFNRDNKEIIPFLKKYYRFEDNLWIRQSIVYALASLNDIETPIDFAKKIYFECDEALINRSWTLCFYQDVLNVDPYLYLDDNKSDWTNARNARINRISKRDVSYIGYLPIDLAILLSFAKNRNYTFNSYEKNAIENIFVDEKVLGIEAYDFVNKMKEELLTSYC